MVLCPLNKDCLYIKDKYKNMEYKKDTERDELKKAVQTLDGNKHIANRIKAVNGFPYAYKKTERLSTALYMVSDKLSDNDPLKVNIRQRSITLLDLLYEIGDSKVADKADVLSRLEMHTMNLISLLDLGYYNGLFSEMNVSVLKREFLALLDHIKDTVLSGTNSSFSDNFFDVPDAKSPYLSQSSAYRSDVVLNRNTELPKSDLSRNVTKPKNTEKKPVSSSFRDRSLDLDTQKKDRRSIILSLINERGAITATEVAKVISNYSQKTIQRELLSMVKNGSLKKEGERRWSKYSLAD